MNKFTLRIKTTIFVILIFILSVYARKNEFTVFTGGIVDVPYNLSETWNEFPSAALGFIFPTVQKDTKVSFTAYYGELVSSKLNVKNPVMHLEIGLNYRMPFTLGYVSVDIYAALIDWAVKQVGFGTDLEQYSLIASWENEFGAAFGVIPSVKLAKDVTLFIPVRASIILSAPDPFISASGGLSVGYTFGSGKNE